MTVRSNRNIVLICLDSVRKDYFEKAALRTIDLSDILFDQCRAASSWSAPSHACMISGLLPYEHGVHTYSRSFDTLPKEKTIFNNFDNYRTVGISANPFAGPGYDFDRYFDCFFEINRSVRFPEVDNYTPFSPQYDIKTYVDFLKHCFKHVFKSTYNNIISFINSIEPIDLVKYIFDRGAKSGLRLAKKELQNRDEPIFIFLNVMESHIPYHPALYLDQGLYDCSWNWSSSEKTVWELCTGEYDYQYWKWYDQLYQAVIDYLDRQIADFISKIGDDTTVVITSDHGENLGTNVDEGLAGHKSSLSEGVLHVPLNIHNPPNEIPNQKAQYFSHLQLPELLKGIRDGHVDDLTENKISAECVGMSAGQDPPTNYEYWDRMIRCCYRDSKKVVWDSLGNTSQYKLNSEKLNWQSQISDLTYIPKWAKMAFKEDIETYKIKAKNQEREVDISETTKKRLRELGYF